MVSEQLAVSCEQLLVLRACWIQSASFDKNELLTAHRSLLTFL
jgi:hypothetical protein